MQDLLFAVLLVSARVIFVVSVAQTREGHREFATIASDGDVMPQLMRSRSAGRVKKHEEPPGVAVSVASNGVAPMMRIVSTQRHVEPR